MLYLLQDRLLFVPDSAYVSPFAPYLKPYLKEEYSVLMPEYRGFAGNAGYLSEENMYGDAEVWFDHAQNVLKYDRIVVMGYSMGTAPASRLAGTRSPAAVVLMALFYSLLREVQDKNIPLAVKLLTRRLESYKYIAAYGGALLIVHGQKDRLIAARHGKDLFELSPSGQKNFLLFEDANHHMLFFKNKYHRFVLQWLKKLSADN